MIKSASMTGEKDYEGTCSGRLASSRNDAPGAGVECGGRFDGDGKKVPGAWKGSVLPYQERRLTRAPPCSSE